jgi:hypothetical protein
MADDDWSGEERSSSGLLILIAGVAFLLALSALAWIYFLQGRVATLETRLDQTQERSAEQAAQQAAIRRELRATTEAFGAKVGITQQQIEARASEILRQQQAANLRLTALMAKQDAATRKQVNTVSTAVSSVQTDVGGVKQEVASTQRELASTEEKLQAAIGDMGVESGLIAKNAKQLDILRHLGDRNYFEFTLRKGQPPLALSTIKLRLRKADAKHSRYTLEIFSDDKQLQKKNRDLDEPLQFYSGKPPMMFEIVVNEIGKNEVSGYLSTPKTAPQPVGLSR